MALETSIPTDENPFGTATLATAYSRVVFFAYDETTKAMRVVLNVYGDKASRAAGKQPIRQEELVIGREAHAAVLDSDNNVIKPRVPSFDEVLADNAGDFESIKKAVYLLVKGSHPKYRTSNDV